MYAPVKQSKFSCSNCETGARILIGKECAQIIFECEENEKKARKVAREPRK